MPYGVKVKSCVGTTVISTGEGDGAWVVYTVVPAWAEPWTVYIFATEDWSGTVVLSVMGKGPYRPRDGAPMGSVRA